MRLTRDGEPPTGAFAAVQRWARVGGLVAPGNGAMAAWRSASPAHRAASLLHRSLTLAWVRGRVNCCRQRSFNLN